MARTRDAYPVVGHSDIPAAAATIQPEPHDHRSGAVGEVAGPLVDLGELERA